MNRVMCYLDEIVIIIVVSSHPVSGEFEAQYSYGRKMMSHAYFASLGHATSSSGGGGRQPGSSVST